MPIRNVYVVALCCSLFAINAFSFTLSKEYKKQKVAYSTMRIVVQSKKAKFEEMRLKFIEKLVEDTRTIVGAGNTGILELSSDKLTKIEKLKKFSTYVPEAPGVKDEDVTPDIIIFIKRFGTQEKTKMETEYSNKGPFPGKNQYTVKENEYQEFSFVYFFWDNRTGKIIGYSEVSEDVQATDYGIKEKDENRLINSFCSDIISSLREVRAGE